MKLVKGEEKPTTISIRFTNYTAWKVCAAHKASIDGSLSMECE